MLKKKGGLAFKPKAPQLRRPAAASTPSSQGQQPSVTADRQSDTPVPTPSLASQDSHLSIDGQSSANATPSANAAQNAPSGEGARTAHSSDEANVVRAPEQAIKHSTKQSSSTRPTTRSAPQPPDSSTTSTPDVIRAAPSIPTPPESVNAAARKRKAPAEDVTEDVVSQAVQGNQTTPGPSQASSAPRKRQKQARQKAAVAQQPPSTSEAPASNLQPESNAAAPARQTKRKAGKAQGDAGAPQPKKRRITTKKTAKKTANPDNTGGEQTAAVEVDGQEAHKPKKKRAPRKKKPTTENTNDGAQENTQEEAAASEKRRERSVTPENAETLEINRSELRMEDLTKDLRIGKKFSRHDELLDREREQRVKKKQIRDRKLKELNGEVDAQDTEPGAEASTSADGPPGETTGRATISTSRAVEKPAAPSPIAGPQFEVIDGSIVVNQASLIHDRHAEAAAEAGELEEVEENDFTHHTTSNTYLKPGKLRGPNCWNDAETEQFYAALRMFGTDFYMISQMFPGKSRRHVKLKFNREERQDLARVNAALVGKKDVAIDLDEYTRRTRRTYEESEVIEAKHQRREDDWNAEQQAKEDMAAENLKKQRDAVMRRINGEAPEEDSAAAAAASGRGENTNVAPKKGNAQQQQSSEAQQKRFGGPPGEEQLEEVDETDLPERAGQKSTRGRGRGRGGRGRGRARQAVAGGFGA